MCSSPEEEEPQDCPCMLVTYLPTPFNQSGSVFSIVQIGFRRQNSETVPKSSALLLGTLYKPRPLNAGETSEY